MVVEKTRRLILGMLLENVGMDAVVRLGRPGPSERRLSSRSSGSVVRADEPEGGPRSQLA
jgi:hypothetical protein